MSAASLSVFSASTVLLVIMDVQDGQLWLEGAVTEPTPRVVCNTRSDEGSPDDLADVRAEWRRRADLLRRMDMEPTP